MTTARWLIMATPLVAGFIWWRATYYMRLIKAFEDLSLTPYIDSGGVWTIGWGHKILPGDPYYPQGDVKQITPAEANKLLDADAAKARAAVNAAVKVPLNSKQKAALISFTYNVGVHAFVTSTLVRKLNDGDYAGAAAEFSRWNHDNGKVVAGLTERRAIEQAIFTA